VRVTADTNILLRDALHDDPEQWPLAARTLQQAELIAIPVAALCEFVWVLRQGYKLPASDVAESLKLLLASPNVATNRQAAEAGLRMLEAGGDFADGTIAYEGEWLGGNEFVSFDRKAVTLLQEQGKCARLLRARRKT
jgi:predicted nucleic-acid-binding protein